jgi:hypothetical protein
VAGWRRRTITILSAARAGSGYGHAENRS